MSGRPEVTGSGEQVRPPSPRGVAIRALCGLPAGERQAIADAYRTGEKPKAIGRRHGLTTLQVVKLCRRLGCRPQVVQADWTEAELGAIRRRYPAEGAIPLAAAFGRSAQAIKSKAFKLGVRCPIRTLLAGATTRRRNGTARLDFFDRWTPEMAYVLGYLWADGCIATTAAGVATGVHFLCTEDDADLLRQIAAAMGHTGNLKHGPAYTGVIKTGRYAGVIKTGRYAGRTYTSRPRVYFAINSRHLAARLAEVHGILPRKTYLNSPYPEVPDEFLHHFARGNLDGDGTVCVREGRAQAAVNWLGSPRFTRGLGGHIARVAEVLDPSYDPKGIILRATWYARSDILRLHSWLYRDATICLARKKEKFEAAARVLAGTRDRVTRERREAWASGLIPAPAI